MCFFKIRLIQRYRHFRDSLLEVQVFLTDERKRIVRTGLFWNVLTFSVLAIEAVEAGNPKTQ